MQNMEKIKSKKPPLVIKLNDGQSYSTQEVTTIEEYNSVPVELFGEALLRMMSWDDDIVDAYGNTTDEKKIPNRYEKTEAFR